MESFSRPTEQAIEETLIGPGIKAGALEVLQNLPYIRNGVQFGHTFDCLLGKEEKRFVRHRIHKADRSTDVLFEKVNTEDGEFVTQVIVVKGGRR